MRRETFNAGRVYEYLVQHRFISLEAAGKMGVPSLRATVHSLRRAGFEVVTVDGGYALPDHDDGTARPLQRDPADDAHWRPQALLRPDADHSARSHAR